MRSIIQLGIAGACFALVGAPLAAQRPAPAAPPHGAGRQAMAHPAGMPMTDCPMMSAMMHGPAAALRAGTALKLSAAQRTTLEALQRRVDAAGKPSLDSMHAIHAQLTALLAQPTLDERAARAAFDRMGRVHTEMGLSMLRAAREVSTILTPVQRDSLAAIAKRQMPNPGMMPMSGMPMHPMPGPGAAPRH